MSAFIIMQNDMPLEVLTSDSRESDAEARAKRYADDWERGYEAKIYFGIRPRFWHINVHTYDPAMRRFV